MCVQKKTNKTHYLRIDLKSFYQFQIFWNIGGRRIALAESHKRHTTVWLYCLPLTLYIFAIIMCYNAKRKNDKCSVAVKANFSKWSVCIVGIKQFSQSHRRLALNWQPLGSIAHAVPSVLLICGNWYFEILW